MDPTQPELPKESLEELFLTLETPLLRECWRLTGCRATAQDIVQEAFMKLHQHFKEVNQPKPWLYRTARNLSLNHLRKHSRQVALPETGEPGHSDLASQEETLPDEHIARAEAIGQARLCLASLDDRSAEVVRLKFQEDLSYKEIASRTGLTQGHVGYLLHHALKNLAVELRKVGVTP